MARYQLALGCVFALGTLPALPASAQTNILTLAQAAPVPKRALPIPNKPVSIEAETVKAARINNWTVGLAGGLLEGTFSKYAADMGKTLDDSDNMRVLPIISYGAVGNVTDLVYLKGVVADLTPWRIAHILALAYLATVMVPPKAAWLS